MLGPGTHVSIVKKRALTALIGLLLFAGTSFAAPPATTLYGIMGDATSSSYQFAKVDTITGLATTIFSFTLPYPVSALAYDPNTGKFVAIGQVGSDVPYVGMVVEIDAIAQTLEQHAITGLPVSPYTNFVGIEYDPTQYSPSQTASDHVLVTYGQDPNHNLQNRIAAINPLGAVVDYTEPLAVSDFDIAVFNPATSQLIDADTNDSPFEVISDVFGADPVGDDPYASPNNDGELSDAAASADCPGCSATDGTIFFSRRKTHDLWKLTSDGSGYEQVGLHSPELTEWAVGGLAFAPELSGPAGPAVQAIPALSPRMLVLLAGLLTMVGWIMLRRLPG